MESWQHQAARYVRTTLGKEHPDATGPRVTSRTNEGLDVAYFGPTGRRIARLGFAAYKGGWRLETSEECVSKPPAAGSGHY